MNDKRSEQASSTHQVEVTPCGPGCNCGTTGLRTKGKVIVCLVVAIAAAVVLARGLARKAESKSVQGQDTFAATTPAISPKAPPTTTGKGETTDTIRMKSSLWGDPLKNMASLNELAVQKDAVFLYLPEKGRGPDETVKLQIEKAADKAQTGGTMMAFFTLDDNSHDYAQVTSQVPAPCVLAMVKRGGMRAVTDDISEGKLLQAIVEASRPSGCGPSGCGPSGCK